MNEPNYWNQAAATILTWMFFVFFGVLLAAAIKWAWGLLIG